MTFNRAHSTFALIVLLVACSPPPSDPAQAARAAAARAISERVLVNCDTDVVYQSGMQSLARADSDIASQRWSEANTELRNGLEALDHKYDPHGLMADDTGLHLELANSAERRGDLRFAANKRRQIYSDRLAAYYRLVCH